MKKVGQTISLKGMVFEIRKNILGTLILSDRNSCKIYRLDGCKLREV